MKWLSTMFLGFALVMTACTQEPSESFDQAADDTALEHAIKHADPTYVCPMHPQIVRGEAGSCPICGMDLVEQEAGDSGEEAPPVTVGAGLAFNLGLKTTAVSRGTLWKYIETVGRVGYNEDRLWHVHPRSSGWVENLYVKSAADVVTKGQVLLDYYSPEILAAQEAFLLTLDGHRRLQQRSRERLQLLGVPEDVVRSIAKNRKTVRAIPVRAVANGTVSALNLREGMYIKPDLDLLTLADLSTVWMLVDVFEHQLDWVKVGNPVEMTVGAVPGRVWKGEVEFLYPELDPKTRSLKLRLRFENADGVLKPNMFADVAIFAGPKRDILTLPQQAVIASGHGSRVVKKLEDERYQPVEVVTGMASKGRVEILSGLSEGDVVVTSAQFLIDSESNLKASISRFSADAAHRH